MKYLYIVLLLISSFTANADPYAYLAIEKHDIGKDSFIQKSGEPINNLVGIVELGYNFDDRYSIYARHMSSVQQKDTGYNAIGIKVNILK